MVAGLARLRSPPVRTSVTPSRDPTDYSFAHHVRVRFAETDAMGVVHHAAYLPYLEEARVAFLRHIGHPYELIRQEGIDFSVLECTISYLRALRFDDVATIHLAVAATTRATFQIAYLVVHNDEHVATAVTVHGSVDREGRAARTPEWLRQVMAAQVK